MADTTKRIPLGIVENLLVKIDKFLFLSDFVVMDMLINLNETMILGRPFLATIHAKIDVFNKEISLGISDERITFNMNKKNHNFITPVERLYSISSVFDNESIYTPPDKNNDQTPEQEQVRHTDVSEPVKKNPLKTWLVDCFQNDLTSDPLSRSFNDYKYMFDLEIDLMADEYAIGIEKEKHEAECSNRKYLPLQVHVEKLEFLTGQKFICVNKESEEMLSLGRENGSKFKKMIRSEIDK
ncbi:putative reverse transcriptase domain-containing protein [Tanacetum coccineum]